jgi:SecD/SecF fusion protein
MRLSALVVSVVFLLGIAACDSEQDRDLTTVVLRNAALTEHELDRARDVMEARIEKLGLKDATIERRDRELVAELPRGQVEKAVAVLTKEGKLEIFDLQGDLLKSSIDGQGNPRASTSRPQAKENSVILRCRPPGYCPGADPAGGPYYYLIRYKPDDRAHPVPELTGADFELGSIRQEFDQFGEPIVLVNFTPRGAKKFERLTHELAERGRVRHNRAGGEPTNAYQQAAIVVDRQILSAPTVDFRVNPAGISGENGVQISGIGSAEEVRDLAIAFSQASCPRPFTESARNRAAPRRRTTFGAAA